MDAEKRDLIRRTLRSLAEAHAQLMELMEQAMALLNEELAFAPVTCGQYPFDRRCSQLTADPQLPLVTELISSSISIGEREQPLHNYPVVVPCHKIFIENDDSPGGWGICKKTFALNMPLNG